MKQSFEKEIDGGFQQILKWYNFSEMHNWLCQTLKHEGDEPMEIEKSVLEGFLTLVPKTEHYLKFHDFFEKFDWENDKLLYFYSE